jgi:hypothetical protein
MKSFNLHPAKSWVRLGLVAGLAFLLLPLVASATAQWTRKTGMSCGTCHSVFPRLNSFGEEFLRNGYQLPARASADSTESSDVSFVEEIGNLLGFRINVTPVMLETNALRTDSLAAKQTRVTIGSANWIQMFVAGSVMKDVSFFTELEMAKSAFKFNWFYFNFTNLLGTSYVNFQLGNISPLEFTSYPNRLPQLPALKSELMTTKVSAGKGEESVDMSSARPGLQFYSRNEWALLYAGVSPGTSATDINQYLNAWTGLVLKLPEDLIDGFEGTTATIHYYNGTDTKGTGSPTQLTNEFYQISPQLNLRYDDMIDIQAAYVVANESNRGFQKVAENVEPETFQYSGVGLDVGVMPVDFMHVAVHYDNFKSDVKVDDKPVIEYHRIVPAVTFILNENIRGSLYYEHDLTDKPADDKINKLYINMRAMF